jgi:cytochrome c peroxidase
MHDGSIATLEEVLDHYAQGGRTIETGPNAGVGAESPRKSEFVPGFILSDQETQDVIAFLESLTDESFLRDERFANPWTVRPSETAAESQPRARARRNGSGSSSLS